MWGIGGACKNGIKIRAQFYRLKRKLKGKTICLAVDAMIFFCFSVSPQYQLLLKGRYTKFRKILSLY